jgi:small subunit ribosomal protein S7
MRKKRLYKKSHRPDAIYDNIAVSRFINYLMREGKKSVAERVMYDAMDIIGKKSKQEAIKIFEAALENTTPSMEVMSRRIGGANYQIPIEVRPNRKFFLASNWIIGAARSRKGKPMAEKLADEFLLASKNEGEAVKKKQNVHRVAEANRAFAHFARG